MKKTFYAFAAAVFMASSCVTEVVDDRIQHANNTLTSKLVGNTAGDIEQGTLLVRLNDEAAELIAGGADAAAIFGNAGIREIAPALSVAPKNPKIARKYGLDKWFEIRFAESVAPQKMAENIASCKAVRSIQYNSFIKHIGSEQTYEHKGALVTKGAAGDLPFNDPMLGDQWNLINTGDKAIAATAVAGADVGVVDAWNLTAGIPEVVVAVLDEGVRLTHEDLNKALWVNEAESNGTGGKDDDGNGYIDDTNGYNFAEGKSRPCGLVPNERI